MPMQKNSVYILLFYLRTTSEHKYHWALLLTGPSPPAGKLYHATDENRRPLDLVRQTYPTRSGMLHSQSVVVALYVGPIAENCLDWASRDEVTHLMDPRYPIPRGEPRWTCRVWVKTVLEMAEHQRYIRLPAKLDWIELSALATADRHINSMGNATQYNDTEWLRNTTRAAAASSSRSRTVPMDIDSTGGRGGGGAKPMQGIEYHGTARRQVKPADIKAAVELVTKQTGGIFNYLDLDVVRNLLEINFYGPLAITQAFAPLLIKAKGMAVFITSVFGYINVPFMGTYAASKRSLELAAETLRLGLAPFGADVLEVVTGGVQSKGQTYFDDFKLPEQSLYKSIENVIASRAQGKDQLFRIETAGYANAVADKIASRTTGRFCH
ncbi:hypothetical protein VSDG_06699 [Cytospora chrysosperma]|uniref:Uncharacterized protein n=1 Tax=Cytospora chrysosperma TaxID=252740 RepID=A0A423VNE8_CYTCH|nr:hypothetical protein VSDG_06699 [Valsa sordida]